MKWKNVGAAHTTETGRNVQRGEVFESDLPLDTLFVGKFERVYKEAEAEAEAEAPKAPDNTEQGALTEKKECVSSDREDVTTEFPGAAEAGLVVVKDKKGWCVYDEGNAPINEKPLRKKDVLEIVAEYTTE